MGRKVIAMVAAAAIGLLLWWAAGQGSDAESAAFPQGARSSDTPKATGAAPSEPDPAEIERAMHARIRAGAEASGRALLEGDDPAVVDLTYPGVIVQAGGREAMLEAIAAGRRIMAEQKYELTSFHRRRDFGRLCRRERAATRWCGRSSR